MNDLERVTVRAVECGIYGANKTLLNAAPRALLAFEQATLKESVIAVEAIDAELLSAQAETIEQLTAKLAMQAELLEDAVEDVSCWGNYADDHFKEKWNLARDVAKYKDAAKATQADVEVWKAKQCSELKEKYDINEASNKAVELALEDVPYKGSYADGINLLKQTIEQLQREKAVLFDVCVRVLNGDLGSWESDVRAIEAALESTKESTTKWMAEQDAKNFELFGYIEPRKNFEPMEAEAVYIVGEKDFDGCTVALYRRRE